MRRLVHPCCFRRAADAPPDFIYSRPIRVGHPIALLRSSFRAPNIDYSAVHRRSFYRLPFAHVRSSAFTGLGGVSEQMNALDYRLIVAGIANECLGVVEGLLIVVGPVNGLQGQIAKQTADVRVIKAALAA